MPSMQDLLALQQQQGQGAPSGAQPGGLLGALASGPKPYATPYAPVGPTDNQLGWKASAQHEDQVLRGGMPYQLDLNSLSTDPAANKARMYPAMQQQGGAPYTPVAGKNLGPALQDKAPGVDFSAIQSIDDLAKMISEQAGISLDDAKAFLKTQMGAGASPSGAEPNFQFSF